MDNLFLPRLNSVLATLCLLAPAGLSAQSLIRNGGFHKDLSGWSYWFAPGLAEGKQEWVREGAGGYLHVHVKKRKFSSSIQVYQGPVHIRKGQRYQVRFRARAPQLTSMMVSLMLNDPPYTNFGLRTTVPVTTEWQPYFLSVTATGDSDNARLDFFSPPCDWMLDDVAIVEDHELSKAVKPVTVVLGTGWNGNAALLVDGKAGTGVGTRSYPRRPVFVLLDMGRPVALRNVEVQARDLSRHQYVRSLAVELSDDGTEWHEWAAANRGRAGFPGLRKIVTFRATSMMVRARFIRIRLADFRWMARLQEVVVHVGPENSGSAVSVLPETDPVKDLCFLGWDYERLGYALSPGERIELTWESHATREVRVPVSWRLTDYAGKEESSGSDGLIVAPGAKAAIRIPLPADLEDGPKFIHWELKGSTQTVAESYYFDYRAPAGDTPQNLKVVALLDNDDSEGWVRMMAGPLARHLNALSDWPSDGSPVDAVLVQAEGWKQNDPRIQRLEQYLRQGGRALVFGRPAPGLAPLLPVRARADSPFDPKPMALRNVPDLPGFNGFDLTLCPKRYRVAVLAKPGARVLAQWDDGSPAMVQGSLGRGRVVFVSTGTGQVWQERPEMAGADELTLRLLYSLAGRPSAFSAALDEARRIYRRDQQAKQEVTKRVFASSSIEKPEKFIVTGRNNVGRFGWLLNGAGLVDQLSEQGEMRTCADPRGSWSFQVPGVETLRPRLVSQNWISKTVDWSGGERRFLRSTVSTASPGILWEGTLERVQLEVPGTTHLVFPSQDGATTLEKGKADIPGRAMNANWLVLLNASENTRDVPKLIVFTRRPVKVALEDKLEIQFPAGGFGALVTSRLMGIRRLGPGESGRWANSFPGKAARAAAFWGRAFLRFPVVCDEVAWPQGNEIFIADRFQYRSFKDAWGTAPLNLAPLPPVMPLARMAGAPLVFPAKTFDTHLATLYGPLVAVEGDSALVRVPLPPHDHFGVVPVAGKMDLQKDLGEFALTGISKVTRASGGLTSGSEFLEDLRTYMSSGQFPPFEAPVIDLYKWWYCFPALTARPAYDAATRQKVDAHYRTHYWQTLNFYPHKCFVRYRREPWTGLGYTISFIWPTFTRSGVRYFVDQNESSAVIAYCYEMWARYYGDATTLRTNWNLCRRLYEFLPRFHDWAWMTSSNQEVFGTAGIDMLNSEYPGNLAFARAARLVGDIDGERLGLVLAAKALVPAVARFAMPDYIRSITADRDPWRENRYYYSFHKTSLGGAKGIDMRGGPYSIMDIAIGMLDTAKGTGPEIALAYKSWAPGPIERYERALKQEEQQRGRTVGWAHLMQRSLLRWPRSELLQTARKFHEKQAPRSWQATKAPHLLAMLCVADSPLFLADWSPAEYSTGLYDPATGKVELELNLPEGGPCNLRVYSQREVVGVRCNGSDLTRGGRPGWSYDAATGWLRVLISGSGKQDMDIRLGRSKAPLHPYFQPPAR